LEDKRRKEKRDAKDFRRKERSEALAREHAVREGLGDLIGDMFVMDDEVLRKRR